MNKKYIFVTGSRGFIGTNFCEKFLRDNPDYSIISIDSRTYASNYFLEESDRFIDYEYSIDDKHRIEYLFDKYKNEHVEGLINFAAESHVDNSISNPYPFERSNYYGVMNLLNFWKDYFPRKRFLQISTDEVYGSVSKPSIETDALNPSSVYSATKTGAELLCKSYYKTFGVDVVITRCGNNFGKFQHEEKFIPKIIKNILNGEKIPVYGDGLNIRQWTSVENHVQDIWNCFINGNSGEIYNIGGGTYKTNIELVKIILNKLNANEDLISFVPDRFGHDFMYSIDCSKYLNGIGNRVEYISFESALDSTINYYKNYFIAKSFRSI